MAPSPRPPPGDDPFMYDISEITSLLSPHLNARAIESFKENEVSGRVLLTLASYAVLKEELGIASLGRRERIMTVVKKLRARSQGYQEWVFEEAVNTPLPGLSSPVEDRSQEIQRMRILEQMAGRKRKRWEGDREEEEEPLQPRRGVVPDHIPILVNAPFQSGEVAVRIQMGEEVHWGNGVAVEATAIPVVMRDRTRTVQDEVLQAPIIAEEEPKNQVQDQDIPQDERQLAMEKAAHVKEPTAETAGAKRKRIESINIAPLDAPQIDEPLRMSIEPEEENMPPPPLTGEDMDTDGPELTATTATTSPKRIAPIPIEVEVDSDGRRRLMPTNIEPLRPPRLPTPSPPPFPVVRRRNRDRFHYFPPKGRKIDSLFYDVDVGEEILDEYGEDDDWFSHGFPKPSGERQFVAKHMRRLHNQLSGENPGIRTIYNGHIRGAFRPYSEQKAYQMLRKYEQPSFTVVDAQPNGSVKVFRHTTKSLPIALPWSRSGLGLQLGSKDRTTDTQVVHHSFDPASGPSQNGLSLNDNSNHEWDYLLKWQNVENGEEILPLYGDSGSENEFDTQTWNEIQIEQGPKEKVLGKPTIRHLLSPAEVQQALDDGVREVVQKWRSKELPRLELKAYQRWRKAKRNKCRKQLALNAKNRIHELNVRLGKQKEELLRNGMQWTSMDQIKKVCQGNLSLTITEREEKKWELELMNQKESPPKPEKRLHAPDPASASGEGDDEMDLDDDDDESIGSTDSEMIIDDDDEGLDGFIVGDNVKDDNAPPPPELEPEDLPPPDIVDSQSDNDSVRGSGRRTLARQNISESGNESGEGPTKAEQTPFTPLKTEMVHSATQKPPIDLTVTPAKDKAKRPVPFIIELSDDDDEQTPVPKSRVVAPTVGKELIPEYELRRNALMTMMSYLNPAEENIVLYHVYYHFKDYCSPNRSIADMFSTIRIVLRSLHGEKIKGVAGLSPHMETVYRSIAKFYVGWYCKKTNIPTGYKIKSRLGRRLDNVEAFKAFSTVLQDCIKELQPVQHDFDSSDDDEDDPFRKNNSNPVPTSRSWEGKGKATSAGGVAPGLMDSSSSDDDDDAGGSQRPKRKKIEEDADAKESRERQRKFQLTLKRRIADQRKRAAERGEVIGGGKVIINLGHLEKYKDIVIHDQIAEKLKDHQIKGIQFMWNQIVASGEEVGALLAHTMGLGKTLQVITLLYTLATAGASKDKGIYEQLPEKFQMQGSRRKLKSLVLCPPGLINNWEDEFHQWIPVTNGQYDLENIGETYRIDSKMSSGMRLENITKWHQQGGVLIIGYAMFRDFTNVKGGDSDEQEVNRRVEHIMLHDPQIIVADEAHYLKNPETKLTIAAMRFESTSRIAMTGSPLANNLEEYWSMIEWIHPGFLGPLKEFRNNYVNPIADGLYEDSSKSEQRESLKLLGVLRKDVGMKMHRADISAIQSEMPAKTEFLVTVPLTKLQEEFYTRLLEEVRGNSLITSTFNGPEHSVTSDSRKGQGIMLNVSYLLALVCAHPAVFIKGLQEREDRRKISEAKLKQAVGMTATANVDDSLASPVPVEDGLVDALSLEWAKRLSAAELDGDSIRHSYKMMAFKQIIDFSRQQNDQVLVFTHRRATLNALDDRLKEWGVKYMRIDGDVHTTTRQAAAKDFNKGVSEVMLIATQAGGLGLNLWGANRVIIFDFSFNPMWEQQAVGRAYRMGQRKHVFVYRFLSGGTFETYLWNMAQFKNQLQSRVVDMKNPVRNAKKSLRQYLLPLRETPRQPDIDKFKGKDIHVLDRILAAEDYIRGIANTETFQPDQDDVLTAEEQAEAEAIYKAKVEERNLTAKPRRKLVQKGGDDAMQPPPSTAPASSRVDPPRRASTSSFAFPSASQPVRASTSIFSAPSARRASSSLAIPSTSQPVHASSQNPPSPSSHRASLPSPSQPQRPPPLPQELPGQDTPNRFGFGVMSFREKGKGKTSNR